MNILILGSCRHLKGESKSRFESACQALGTALSQKGDSIILCSQSDHTADPYILRGIRKNRKSKVTLYQANNGQRAEGEDHPPTGPSDELLWKDIPIKICEGGGRILHLRAMSDADAVLAIGGSIRGTHTAIYSAELLSKPIILIPTFGGAAEENWGYFRGRYYSNEQANHLMQPWASDSDKTAKIIAETIASIVKDHARAAAKSRETSALAILALFAIAAWTYIMLVTPSQLSPPIALCLLLAMASVSGSALRLILRRIGAFPTEWAESHAILSVVLGLLIGFGIFLFGGFTNFSLNGKILKIEDYEDVRRIAVTVSPVLFFVAIFMERAWKQLAERGLGRLKRL